MTLYSQFKHQPFTPFIMKLSNPKLSKKGFTLIELLVVISIVGLLGALSYGPVLKHLETAAVNKTTAVCKDITFAISGFELEYDSLPYTGTYPTTDTSYVTSTPAFLDVLMGKNTTINDKGKSFFSAEEASGGVNGLVYTGSSLTSLKDKWGNPFSIRLDFDGNGIIDATAISTPSASGASYKTALNTTDALAATPGKDTLYNDIKDPKSW